MKRFWVTVILSACLSGILALLVDSVLFIDDQCELLLIAYAESDELAPAWYDDTAIKLDKCGIYINHEPGTRGSL